MKTDWKRVYFVGAGGIGMAALERYFLSRGMAVAGYDRTATELTDALRAEGVDIVFDDDPALIPQAFRDPSTTLVVFTPAIPADHRGLNWLRDNGFTIVKRAEALGVITRGSRSLCFAGTHGKTTTSSLAAHILHASGTGCNAFVGGVIRNYDTNCLLDPGSDISVVEADEYDRSFHRLTPYTAVITSTDPDHLDIYGTEEAYLEAFARFTELIADGGNLLIHTDLKLHPRPRTGVRTATYGKHSGDFHAENIRHGEGEISFDFVGPDNLRINDVKLGVPVEINIENTIAAIAGVVMTEPGIDLEAVSRASASFMGPKRRFEFRLKEPGRAIIDDYAHHPSELEASIDSVRALYPDRRLTVAFQPHLYSRTRDFAPDFARVLSKADRLILVDIYPAREEPIEGVDTRLIGRQVDPGVNITYTTKENLPETLKNSNFEVLLTVGAGDIVDELPRIVADAKAN